MAKKVIIIGAGPGGLTAGMLLAHKGYDVQLFERKDVVGGRNAALRLGDFTFDTGPTFLMLPRLLEELFLITGRNISDYLEMKVIDPLYRLKFSDKNIEFFVTRDRTADVRKYQSSIPR